MQINNYRILFNEKIESLIIEKQYKNFIYGIKFFHNEPHIEFKKYNSHLKEWNYFEVEKYRLLFDESFKEKIKYKNFHFDDKRSKTILKILEKIQGGKNEKS